MQQHSNRRRRISRREEIAKFLINFDAFVRPSVFIAFVFKHFFLEKKNLRRSNFLQTFVFAPDFCFFFAHFFSRPLNIIINVRTIGLIVIRHIIKSF